MKRSLIVPLLATVCFSIQAKAIRFSELSEQHQSMVLTAIADAISQGAEPLVVYSPPDGWMRHDDAISPGMSVALGLTKYYRLESFAKTTSTTNEGTAVTPVFLYPSKCISLMRSEATGQIVSFAMFPTDAQVRLILAKQTKSVDKRFMMKPSKDSGRPLQSILADAEETDSNSFMNKYGLFDLFEKCVFSPVPRCSFALNIPRPELPSVLIPGENQKILAAAEAQKVRNGNGHSLMFLSREELSDILYLAIAVKVGSMRMDSEYLALFKRNPDALVPIRNGNLLSSLGNQLSARLVSVGTNAPPVRSTTSLKEAASLVITGHYAEALLVLDHLSRDLGTQFHASLLRAVCLARQGKTREAGALFRSIEYENGWRALSSHVFPDDSEKRHVHFGSIAGTTDLIDEVFIDKVLQAPCVFVLRFERRATFESGRWFLKKGDETLFENSNADIFAHDAVRRFLLLPGVFQLEYFPSEGRPRRWQIDMPEWGYVEKRYRVPTWIPKMDTQVD